MEVPYHVIIVGATADHPIVCKLAETFEKMFVSTSIPSQVIIGFVVQTNDETHDKYIKRLQSAVRVCLVTLVYITDNFVGNAMSSLIVQTCLDTKISENKCRNLIVPVYSTLTSERNYKVPGLDSIKGIELPRLLKNKPVESLMREKVELSDLNQRMVKHIINMVERQYSKLDT